jgi:hypothetical protein
MALTPVYLIAAKNLSPFLEKLRNAKAPDKVTIRFLEQLDFKSTNDRLLIPLLKALRFIDDNGVPTKRYFAFLDDGQSARVLADGIRDAYEDLFKINTKANTLSRTDVSGKLKSLTQGQVSEKVLQNMTKTFVELVKLADFSSPPTESHSAGSAANKEGVPGPPAVEVKKDREHTERGRVSSLTYRIELILPSVRDQAVYDAIFRSLKEHLL